MINYNLRLRRMWIDNIKMERIECCRLDWSGSGYVQVESSCELGNEQTPRPLVRKRTIQTERPPIVGEI
jgi:hypothetical protein